MGRARGQDGVAPDAEEAPVCVGVSGRWAELGQADEEVGRVFRGGPERREYPHFEVAQTSTGQRKLERFDLRNRRRIKEKQGKEEAELAVEPAGVMRDRVRHNTDTEMREIIVY